MSQVYQYTDSDRDRVRISGEPDGTVVIASRRSGDPRGSVYVELPTVEVRALRDALKTHLLSVGYGAETAETATPRPGHVISHAVQFKVRLVKEAQGLLGAGAEVEDVLALARFLAGETS